MTRAERWLLWTSTLAVAVSGFGFAWAKYLVRSDDPFAVVHHPLQPFFLKMHVLTAPILVFAVGFLFSRHVVGRPGVGFRVIDGRDLIRPASVSAITRSSYAPSSLLTRHLARRTRSTRMAVRPRPLQGE